ncbi:cobalt-precorrin-6A reductase [Nocardia harenae]|uniref:cobalt-precorrin-6A reductase n=1 Tax=Nocardia harenae TaxID=358707 RepID=UPI00082E257C|nr:cobalt-precorrin-6A reductase [Nocardia harenae]
MTRVLILGGTAEARSLARLAAGERGLDIVSSLAGRVRAPVLPEGEVRVGGFGGAEGLREYLRDNAIDLLVDATHPFAAVMSAHAAAAAAAAGVALLHLRRPGWVAAQGDSWTRVPSLPAAAAGLRGRVFLTVGRQGVAAFAGVAGAWFLIRAIDPPDPPLPAAREILLARGPFALADEISLLREHRIDVLVTKDSGGPDTEAKLIAARELGVPVIVVDRPPLPAGGAPVVTTVDDAMAWLRGR